MLMLHGGYSFVHSRGKVQRNLRLFVLLTILGPTAWPSKIACFRRQGIWMPNQLIERRVCSTATADCAFAAEPEFKLNTSNINIFDRLSKQKISGEAPSVACIHGGDHGFYAVVGALRVALPARHVFRSLATPDVNMRIFSGTVLKYRKLLEEDQRIGIRIFEVSKVAVFNLLGASFMWDQTLVYAVEDWHALEIRYWLKKDNPHAGMMKHLSGFWRLQPIGQNDTLVHFFCEAEPALRLPLIFKRFGGYVVELMARKLLGDLRTAAATWLPKFEEALLEMYPPA